MRFLYVESVFKSPVKTTILFAGIFYDVYHLSSFRPGRCYFCGLKFKGQYQVVELASKIFDHPLSTEEIMQYADLIHFLIRKCAHVTLYFLLAVSVSFPLYVYGLRGIPLMLVAGGFCIAFACGDEYHQSLVEGRGPSKQDVMIDSIGVLAGVILVRIVGFIGRMTIFKPLSKKRKAAKH